MATTTINHVQNDRLPQRRVTLTDEAEQPVDLSTLAPATIQMHMRERGGAFKATVPCSMVSGLLQEDGTVTTDAPYNVAGRGGRIQIEWTAESVDTAGVFEGEIELVFGDGRTQTAFKTIPINIREQIA